MSKRSDILNTALALFNVYGYTAVGVDRIRDEANASKMTLYKYFPSKEMLIREVLLLRHAQLTDAITHAVAKIDSPSQRLRQLFRWHKEWFARAEFHGCMFIKALDEHPGHISIVEAARQHKQWLIQLINRILADMQIDQSELWAKRLCMQLDGAIVHAAMFNEPQAADHAWQVACHLLERPVDTL